MNVKQMANTPGESHSPELFSLSQLFLCLFFFFFQQWGFIFYCEGTTHTVYPGQCTTFMVLSVIFSQN